MKLPFVDIHLIKGRNVLTDEQLCLTVSGLKAQEEMNDLRNRKMAVLLDKIEHLKGLLRQKG